MRSYISSVLILIFFCGTTMAQTGYPFQVLHAENATLSDGRDLKSFDMVSVEDKIKLHETGYLALVHDTGFSFEFTNDTIIDISRLHSILISPTAGKRKKGRVGNRRFDNGIGLDFLLITNLVNANKRRLDRTVICHDCNTDMEVLYPPFSESVVQHPGDICIRWKSSLSDEYVVEIRSFWDDKLIDRVKKEINEIQINSEVVKNSLKSDKVITLTIKDELSNKTSEGIIIREFFPKEFEYPYSCNIQNPVAALMTGYYLETKKFGHFVKDAEEYYLLATKLSSKKFYQDMLDNYYARQGK